MRHSCLYRGHVTHSRSEPPAHAFRFSLYMLYLDLAELPLLFAGRWFWSTTRPALVRFRRADHLGDPALPLETAVRDLVESRTGSRPQGAIRLLTQLRHFGLTFNPASFYYCFAPNGERIEAVVVEVTNTPWGERHCYVIERPEEATAKTFHVSPFLDMNAEYHWTLPAPGDDLRLRIESRRPTGARCFAADLRLSRHEINGRSLAGALLRHPFMSAQILAGIYWQALRLFWKRAPFHAHPGGTTPSEEPQTAPLA